MFSGQQRSPSTVGALLATAATLLRAWIPISLYKSLQILQGCSSSAHRGIPSQLETLQAWPRVHPWPQPFYRLLPLNGEWAQAGKPPSPLAPASLLVGADKSL